MKRILVILLIAVLALGIIGCVNESGEVESTSLDNTDIEATTEAVPEEKKSSKLILGYYSNDKLNPFEAEGKTNASLSSLFCDGLVSLNADYSVRYVIAESAQTNGKTLTVRLKDGIKFSDGSSLGASDVVYSFERAKTSPVFSSRLSGFASASASGSDVVFNLNEENVYAVNCLDFPVIKSGTGDQPIVVGSGHYVLKKSDKSYVLRKNADYSFNEETGIELIYLTDISEVENKLYLLQIGDLGFMYDDLSAEKAEKRSINANTETINQNDLIYLGFNSSSRAINDTLKKAVALALPREELANSSFGNGAEAADRLFNPAWSELENGEVRPFEANPTAASNLLQSSGYVFSGRRFSDKDGDPLVLELLVCSDDSRKLALADEIKASLEKAGISSEIKAYDEDDYLSKLSRGSYDMYIGEVRLTADMDLSPFFTAGGYVSRGIDRSETWIESYKKFRSGETDIRTFVSLFDESLPFVPLFYVNGIAYYSRELGFEESVCENNIFSNIYSWEM